MGSLQEALWLKEQLLLFIEHERKQIVEACDDGLYEPWVISGSDYYQNKDAKRLVEAILFAADEPLS